MLAALVKTRRDTNVFLQIGRKSASFPTNETVGCYTDDVRVYCKLFPYNKLWKNMPLWLNQCVLH